MQGKPAEDRLLAHLSSAYPLLKEGSNNVSKAESSGLNGAAHAFAVRLHWGESIARRPLLDKPAVAYLHLTVPPARNPC
jgi:hypothetical protein